MRKIDQLSYSFLRLMQSPYLILRNNSVSIPTTYSLRENGQTAPRNRDQYICSMEIIQPVTATDYFELTELWERSVRATHHFLQEEHIQYFKPLILQQYLAAVALRCIKDKNGNILAFSGVLDGKLEMLFVDPLARGGGYGKRLLNYAIQEQAVTKVDVNEANEQAVGFYKHMGFVQTGYSELDGTGKPFPLIHLALRKVQDQ